MIRYLAATFSDTTCCQHAVQHVVSDTTCCQHVVQHVVSDTTCCQQYMSVAQHVVSNTTKSFPPIRSTQRGNIKTHYQTFASSHKHDIRKHDHMNHNKIKYNNSNKLSAIIINDNNHNFFFKGRKFVTTISVDPDGHEGANNRVGRLAPTLQHLGDPEVPQLEVVQLCEEYVEGFYVPAMMKMIVTIIIIIIIIIIMIIMTSYSHFDNNSQHHQHHHHHHHHHHHYHHNNYDYYYHYYHDHYHHHHHHHHHNHHHHRHHRRPIAEACISLRPILELFYLVSFSLCWLPLLSVKK